MSKSLGVRKLAVVVLAALSLLALPFAAGAADMANGITSPKDGATVSGTVDITGYASDPSFWKWQLDVLPGGDADAAIFLAVGETPGEFSLNADTTAFPDGEHALRLRVVRTDSNYTEYVNKFTIANGAAPVSAAAAEPGDIVATAIGAGQFKTLVAAVQAAGLVSALQGAGPFTVFAPTDEAFAALPAGTVEGLLKDPAALAEILKYHVLSGAVKAEAVTDGLSVNTLQGSPVTFTVKDGKPMINDANIVATDVMASNGVIHVIDKVLLPPAAPAAAAAAPAAPMTNGFSNLKDGAKLSGVAEIEGYADDPLFAKWQLDILAGGDDSNAAFVALGETAGVFTTTLDTTAFPDGDYALRLRIVRADSNYTETLASVMIANMAAMTETVAAETPAAVETAPAVTEEAAAAAPVEEAAAAPENGITVPAEGATVSGEVEVMGNASDPDFAKWQLDVLPGGDADAPIFLAVGETPGEFTYMLDTAAFPNGEHALRLRVVRALDGNYETYLTNFTIAN